MLGRTLRSPVQSLRPERLDGRPAHSDSAQARKRRRCFSRAFRAGRRSQQGQSVAFSGVRTSRLLGCSLAAASGCGGEAASWPLNGRHCFQGQPPWSAAAPTSAPPPPPPWHTYPVVLSACSSSLFLPLGLVGGVLFNEEHEAQGAGSHPGPLPHMPMGTLVCAPTPLHRAGCVRTSVGGGIEALPRPPVTLRCRDHFQIMVAAPERGLCRCQGQPPPPPRSSQQGVDWGETSHASVSPLQGRQERLCPRQVRWTRPCLAALHPTPTAAALAP